MSFTVECDPEYRTYITLKFESNPENAKRLFLLDGTDMIGYMHQGVGWPSLDMNMNTSMGAVSTHGDFWYATHRLPGYLTEDSEEVDLRIVSWDGEQPSQGIYRAYTHTDPHLHLPANDKGGEEFELGPIRDPPAENQIDPVVAKIDELVQSGQQNSQISPRGALGLAMAVQRDWIDVVDEDAVFETVRATVDDWAIRQAESSPQDVVHRGWEEHGRFARAVTLLWDLFKERDAFSQTLEGHPDGEITREDAYVQFFGEGLDWRSTGRRDLTNQFMFVTICLVRTNSVLEKFGSDRARSRETIDRWIDEGIGLSGVSLNDDEDKPYSWYQTGSYHVFSEKGLSKEPDHVAHYGELGFSLLAKLYHETGLERVRERAVKASQARAAVRLMVNDAETGNRWAATDGVISIRNSQHPGMSSHLRGYGFKPLFHAHLLGDPTSVRFGKLAMEHNVAGLIEQWWLNVWGVGSLERWIHRVDGYQTIQELDDPSYQTPMHRDRFAWADEDIGVVSITDGSERMLMNLGFGAASNLHDKGVNELARIHHHNSEVDRILNIDLTRTEFPSTGGTWSRPNKLQFAGEFLGVGMGEEARTRRLPGDGTVEIEQAMAGATLPQAASPDGDPWPLAEDDDQFDPDSFGRPQPDPRVAMGIHYRECRYGEYLIGMNSSGAPERGFGQGSTYELELPDGASAATDLMTGERVQGESVAVSPRSTRILKLEFEAEEASVSGLSESSTHPSFQIESADPLELTGFSIETLGDLESVTETERPYTDRTHNFFVYQAGIAYESEEPIQLDGTTYEFDSTGSITDSRVQLERFTWDSGISLESVVESREQADLVVTFVLADGTELPVFFDASSGA
ncbi:hypothetical protein [Salinarchaeum laminariae]|uniref:hypothetical protein n=1 Tax=Salinarchaeum laminariae TaxID=869888 RepID=UPI0020C0462C|nr:hypothetical protein [Salinarchaeum laminariae]